jgi:hypothetical protein
MSPNDPTWTRPEPMHRQLLKYLDYLTFPKAIGEVVRDTADFAGVQYVRDMPREPAAVPAIAYRLVSRVPGMDGIETRKSRLRFAFPNEDSSVTEVWSQWMTCTYQFDVCHHTGPEVDDLGQQFDRLLRDSVGLFLKLGVSEFVFDEQVEDHLLVPSKGISVLSLRWTARLENLEFRTSPTIQSLRLRVFQPQAEDVEAVVRGDSVENADSLHQTFISAVMIVSDPSPSGIARLSDYLQGVDYVVLYDPVTAQSALRWLDPGKRPSPGSTYYVRYLHWTAFSRLSIPS